MYHWFRKLSNFGACSLFPAQPRQSDRLAERRSADMLQKQVLDEMFDIFPGVYQTSVDTHLMASVARIHRNERFLEVGCGCGATTLLLAKHAQSGVGVDINPVAVENSLWNRKRLQVPNVEFFESDVFDNVTGAFDVIICNPPYNHYSARDSVDRMFWDPGDEMKRKFFATVKNYLTERGRIYFGWADFADLDIMLPVNLARDSGFRYHRHFVAASRNGVQRFFVIEFRLETRAHVRERFSKSKGSNHSHNPT